MAVIKNPITIVKSGGKVPALQLKEVYPLTVRQDVQADPQFDGLAKVTVYPVQTETKTVTPSIQSQRISNVGEKFYSPVIVDGITHQLLAELDEDFTPENIKKDVSLFGMVGTYDAGSVKLQSRTASPSTSIQYIRPSAGYDGLSYVMIKGVTSSIDKDIKAENIKSGVEILGVTGTYTGENISLQEKTVMPTEEEQAVTPDTDFNGLSKVTVEAIKIENRTINPSIEEQTVTPTSGKYIKQVTVNPVTASIDINITPENIRKDVTILGVTGTVSTTAPELQEKTVTENGEVTPDEGYDGLSKVTVNVGAQTPQEFTATLSETEDYVYEVPDNVRITKITIPKIKSSDISNLEAWNIRNNVRILDIVGSYTPPTEVAPLELRQSVIAALKNHKIYDATKDSRNLAGYNPVIIVVDGTSGQ